jgi:hypothetical protein
MLIIHNFLMLTGPIFDSIIPTIDPYRTDSLIAKYKNTVY